MPAKYNIRVKGGTPEQNAKFSKEISHLANQVEAEFSKLQQSRIGVRNAVQIALARREKFGR